MGFESVSIDSETSTMDTTVFADSETSTIDTMIPDDSETTTVDTLSASDSETAPDDTSSNIDSSSDSIGSCYDGMQNQDETGIDCGGSTCSMCPSCFDGILNQDELRIDCGGAVCSVCPACTDAFSAPEEITGLATMGDLFAPNLSSDNLTMYFAEFDGSTENILVATRLNRGIVFSAAVPVAEINTTGFEGSPYVSADDLTLYFYSTRQGGVGDRDLWFATRPKLQSAFDMIELVGGVNDIEIDHLPFVSVDGLTLWYTSMRTDGVGDSDIWFAKRTETANDFDAPVNLIELNTAGRETSPWLSADELTIYFVSNRAGGLGANDIWTAARPDVGSAFSSFTNLSTVNSVDAEYDVFLSYDEREIFFSSYRGSLFRLWRAWRDCP